MPQKIKYDPFPSFINIYSFQDRTKGAGTNNFSLSKKDDKDIEYKTCEQYAL